MPSSSPRHGTISTGNDLPVRVTLHGTRGTMPVAGPGYNLYGGMTICFEVEVGARSLIFDAGTGILAAGKALARRDLRDFDLFLTHCHYDHVIGLPALKQLYCSDTSLRIWSGHLMPAQGGQAILADLMRDPFFPVGPEEIRARTEFRDFLPGDVLRPAPEISISTGRLNHPGGAVGYRIEAAGRVIAIITDTEHHPEARDETVLELIRGADLMLYDAAFCDEEMARFRGWGHSTWQEALRLAEEAGVARTGLIHHSPWRDDAALDAINAKALLRRSGAFAGRDGQRIDL